MQYTYILENWNIAKLNMTSCYLVHHWTIGPIKKIRMQNKDATIQQLTEQNNELENYFKNTIIPQLFVDAQLVLRKFTPPAMKLFDLSLNDLGKPIDKAHDNFRYPTLGENIQHVIDSNEILEKEIQTTDKRWYQMNIIPYIQMETNTANGVIITFVEITMRIKDLKEQEKLIADHETLLDMVSHDIKNPLTNLRLAIDEMKNSDSKEDQHFDMLVGIIERALFKMQHVIQDLTETREAEHKYKSSTELLNIENILEDVRITLSDEINAAGATIKMDIQVSEVTFSRRKLRSIMYNLLNNAIKYRSPKRKPEIFVSTFRQQEHTLISIKDNGIGIDIDKQAAVFDKYYRVNNALEGTGIGLYLVQEMVMNAGGTISMDSKLDMGTEISISLKS